MPTANYERLGSFYLGRSFDPAKNADTDELILYDARDLTTHAVCVGMTGSGKTGLGLALLEEAAIDGIPAIAIDPKGDLGNLMLTFPQLAPADFQPWVDAGEAQRKGESVEQYANETAQRWRQGLLESGQDGERIARLRAAVDINIYTPGSTAGRPLSPLKSFVAPPPEVLQDSAALNERVAGVVSGVLALLGREVDPVRSPETIFLSMLFTQAWSAGQNVDLLQLIQKIQKPGFDTVGAFDLESFYPLKERSSLAMALNALLVAPAFAAWLQGEPLDVQRLLYTPEGKPRLSIISIAHLSDAERMAVVTLLMSEVVAWMRRQSGTTSLRAIVYMDEIFGYFPPSAMPPSKTPLLTLMKQARAFGVGVVLATQNPVDLDYKGLSNAGTWFIGRLQTERDKARLMDGLADAQGWDRAKIEPLIAQLGNRVFLMRNVHEDAAVLMRTRWTMSYLRGPLTLQEIAKLTTSVPVKIQPANATPAPTIKPGNARPVIPAGINENFLAGAATAHYVPRLFIAARVHFVDGKSAVDQWQTMNQLVPLLDDASAPDWDSASPLASGATLLDKAPDTAEFATLPGALLRAGNYEQWKKDAADYLYRSAGLPVVQCAALKRNATPGTSEGDFRAQVAVSLREVRDAQIEQLRKKYAPKLATLTDQIHRAQDRTAREQSQLTGQKVQTAIAIGTTLLGALFGRKTLSATNVSRAGSAIRNAGRISQEHDDVTRAQDSVQVLQQRLTDLQNELDQEIAGVQSSADASTIELQTMTLKPRKSDTVVTKVSLLWVPV